MVAVIEIEILQVNDKKRSSVYHDIVFEQGPPDGTIILSLTSPGSHDTHEFDDEAVDHVLELLAVIGDAILVR